MENAFRVIIFYDFKKKKKIFSLKMKYVNIMIISDRNCIGKESIVPSAHSNIYHTTEKAIRKLSFKEGYNL